MGDWFNAGPPTLQRRKKMTFEMKLWIFLEKVLPGPIYRKLYDIFRR